MTVVVHSSISAVHVRWKHNTVSGVSTCSLHWITYVVGESCSCSLLLLLRWKIGTYNPFVQFYSSQDKARIKMLPHTSKTRCQSRADDRFMTLRPLAVAVINIGLSLAWMEHSSQWKKPARLGQRTFDKPYTANITRSIHHGKWWTGVVLNTIALTASNLHQFLILKDERLTKRQFQQSDSYCLEASLQLLVHETGACMELCLRKRIRFLQTIWIVFVISLCRTYENDLPQMSRFDGTPHTGHVVTPIIIRFLNVELSSAIHVFVSPVIL